MRVLIVKTSSMGDVLHTLPALTDATKNITDIQFDWVVEEAFTEIPRWHYAVEQVIPVALRRWRKSWFTTQSRKERKIFYQQLRQRHYDVVIDVQGLIKSAFFITRKVQGLKQGYHRQSIKEPVASYFYDIKHVISKELHAVERIRQLMALSLDYVLPSTQGDYAIASHFMNDSDHVNGEPYIVFLHATTKDEKHWPEAYWRALIELSGQHHYRVKLPWGTHREQQRAQRLAQGLAFVDVLPKLSLTQIAHYLAGAKAIVSVDTGLSHLAAALDRPNIILYGPTDPGLIGGYGQNQIICKEGMDLVLLQPEQIWQQLIRLL